jgi:hypothetical protein
LATKKKNADVWRPSETELLSAGVVTQVSNGDEYALAGLGGNKFTRDDWDKSLQKSSPVYKAVEEKFPKSYEEMLDVFSDGLARGTPQAELKGGVRAKLSSLIKALLPQADDVVLIAFGRLATDQYRALEGQDNAACYRYASGKLDEATLRLIPKHLSERELELNAMLVSSTRNQSAAVRTDASWDKIRASLGQNGFTENDVQMLTGGGAISPSNYARYCDFAIILYQEITNLPTKEAASVLRELFKGG